MREHAGLGLLHDDEELAELIGGAVAGRTTVHEWPLSLVQRIVATDGRRFIYKIQRPPTLEAEFYAAAASPLLVPVRVLDRGQAVPALLMDEADAPRLNDLTWTERDAATAAKSLIGGIASIAGELPAMADIRTEDRWAAHIGGALADIRALIDEGGFRRTDDALLGFLRRLAEAPALLEAVNGPGGFVHADLKADNVLAAQDGCRVLDWQRPIRGPVALDGAALLISLGFDPAPHFGAGIAALHHMLHIAWYAEAARRWLPEGKPFLDGTIARIGGKLKALYRDEAGSG